MAEVPEKPQGKDKSAAKSTDSRKGLFPSSKDSRQAASEVKKLKNTAEKAAKAAPKKTEKARKVATARVSGAPQASKSGAKEAAPKPPAGAGTAGESVAPSSWTVQAGTFSVESNARALVERLRKQNLSAVLRPYHGETATVYRVTVGPESSRARADQILKQIESTVGLKGMILPRR